MKANTAVATEEMSDCKTQQCCDVSPFSGECCQPNTFQSGFPNDEQCFVATCATGLVGNPAKVYVPRGTFFKATLAEANEIALAKATLQAQGQLICSQMFFNTEQTATANCPIGYTGTATRTIAAGQYTSTVSQADADSKAYAAALVAATSALVCSEDPCHPYSTSVNVTLTDPCALSANGHAFYVMYSGGVSMAPGATILYASQAACEAANAGVHITFQHNAVGPIVIFLNDTPYDDNVAGSPTPGFQLAGPGGTSITVRPDIFSGTASIFDIGGTDLPAGTYTLTYINGAMGYNSSLKWKINDYAGASGAPLSLTYTYGPYYHQNVTAAIDLSTHFPYVTMWDGTCPVVCRNNPRAHTSGGLTFGPYAFNVEIFAITPLVFCDDYKFTSGSLQGNCGGPPVEICAGTIVKTLTAGLTTTLNVYDTDGAHAFAVGWIGVRPAGATTACATEPTGDVCGCGTGDFNSLACAMQERYRQGNGWSTDKLSVDGTWLDFPDIVVAGNPVVAAKYPVAGFYESDDTWALASRKATLLQGIHDEFVTNSGLFSDVRNGAFTPRLTLEGFYPTINGDIYPYTDCLTNNIPRYQNVDPTGVMFAATAYQEFYPETYIAPLTITSGNWAASLQTLRGYVCKCQHIVLQPPLPSDAVFGEKGYLYGRAIAPVSPAPTQPPTVSSVKSDVAAAWNPVLNSGQWPECSAWCSAGFCEEPAYNIGFRRAATAIGATTSGYTIGKGTINVYAALGTYTPQGNINVFSHVSTAPQSTALDSKFYPVTSFVPNGSNYTSPVFGVESPNWQNACAIPTFNEVNCGPDWNLAIEGWSAKGFVIGIFKSNVPARLAWQYYP